MVSPTQTVEMEIPNGPVNFNDAELGRCLKSRNSYFCTVILVLGVVVQMKLKKTTSPMTHTIDAELKANFEGARNLIPIRKLFEYMGCPFNDPSPLYCDNRAVHSIIESERMTPRCRHLDIPITFLHQEKDQSYQLDLCRTLVIHADMGTKPHSPQLQKLFKYWASGAQ